MSGSAWVTSTGTTSSGSMEGKAAAHQRLRSTWKSLSKKGFSIDANEACSVGLAYLLEGGCRIAVAKSADFTQNPVPFDDNLTCDAS